MFRFVKKYKVECDADTPLHVLNRRFGVRCKAATGVTVREIVESHPETFERGLAATGATVVRARSMHPLEYLIREALAAGPLSSDEILGALKGCGYAMHEFMEVCGAMKEVGVLSIEDGVYKLV